MKRISNLLFMAVIWVVAATGPAQERRVFFGFGPPIASEELAKQPQIRGAKGDQQRHYFFKDANQEMPYHLYVPLNYDSGIKTPLVVALHGYSGNHDYFFAIAGNLKELCEEHGFIFVAPMGYSTGGWYGAPLNIPGSTPRSADAKRTSNAKSRPVVPQKSKEEQLRERALSEKDVMNVLELVCNEYNIDPTRTYLMGHSMGGMGTYFLGQKYAENWAAIAPMSGTMAGVDYHLDRLVNVPILISVGETETTTANNAKAQLKEMQSMGMDAAYLEIEKGTHISMIKPAIPEIFQFFDKHRRAK
jgi:predicted peptidase